MNSRKIVRNVFGSASLAAVLVFAATQAEAHPQLVGSEPVADATVSSPTTIALHFNEPIEARISSFQVTDSDGSPVAVMSSTAPDASSLAAMLHESISPGLYSVSWTAAGADGHPMKGEFSFTVE